MSTPSRLRAWRRWLRISQAAVAERLSCSQVHVSHIESGKRRPNVDIAVAIERETKDWAEGPILVSEWVRPEAEAGSSNEAA